MVSSATCRGNAVPRGLVKFPALPRPGARSAVELVGAGKAAAASAEQDVWSMLTCCVRTPRTHPDEEPAEAIDVGTLAAPTGVGAALPWVAGSEMQSRLLEHSGDSMAGCWQPPDEADAESPEPLDSCEEVAVFADKPSVSEEAADNHKFFNELTCPVKQACTDCQDADSSPVHSPFARSSTCSTCCSVGAEQRGPSVDSAASIQDPKQVVRLEWRSVRRMMSLGLTSHSMLDVVLLDGGRMRFQKFSNVGVVMSRPKPTEADEGEVYDGRVADADDLAWPLREADAYAAAAALSETPYDLLAANCHHFARDLWNSLVGAPLHTEAYPDQLKAAALLQIMEQLRNLPNCGNCSSVSRSFAYLGAE